MSKKALRSLGIGVSGLDGREKKHREALLRKVFADAKPLKHQKVPLLPGVGPHAGFPAGDQMTIVFPPGVLEPVSEKIVRGCEFKLNGEAYVEPPLKVKIYFVHDHGAEDLTAFLDKLATTKIGPGFLVARGQAPPEEGVNIVLYRIVIWGTWKIYAAIDADPQ